MASNSLSDVVYRVSADMNFLEWKATGRSFLSLPGWLKTALLHQQAASGELPPATLWRGSQNWDPQQGRVDLTFFSLHTAWLLR
jgi:hypothetical protein